MDGTGTEAQREGSPRLAAARWILVGAFFLGSAVMAALISVMILRLGFDPLVDRGVNWLFRDLVPDGRLRLAGISAPLSEELSRTAGFVIAIGGLSWVAHRMGIPPSMTEVRSPRVPVVWIFGMASGAVFAVWETVGNGDPLAAVLPRVLGHGSFGTIIVMGLVWQGKTDSPWPVLGGLLLAMLLHGVGNAMTALELSRGAATFKILSTFAVGVGAWMASLVRPDVFGSWAFGLRLGSQTG